MGNVILWREQGALCFASKKKKNVEGKLRDFSKKHSVLRFFPLTWDKGQDIPEA